MQIEITEQTARAILKINERYYFSLFESIRVSEEEEYQFREAIEQIVKEISK